MKKHKKVIITLSILLLTIFIYLLTINTIVKITTKNQILTLEELKEIDNIDCILILGAGIWGSSPSPMLEDRLTTGIDLYNEGISSRLLMSGDHSKTNYDEVNIMKTYAVNKGISSEDIFMDHAGFSTYESIYRASYIFKAQKIVIVTQEYHLYRALYIANSLGLEAYGISADLEEYSGQLKRNLREIFARNKDFLNSIIKPTPTYLGEEIPVSGNGNITNDKI